MPADYKRMYTCLASALDKAVTALEAGDPAQAHRLLQAALLEAEDIYIDTDDTVEPE